MNTIKVNKQVRRSVEKRVKYHLSTLRSVISKREHANFELCDTMSDEMWLNLTRSDNKFILASLYKLLDKVKDLAENNDYEARIHLLVGNNGVGERSSSIHLIPKEGVEAYEQFYDITLFKSLKKMHPTLEIPKLPVKYNSKSFNSEIEWSFGKYYFDGFSDQFELTSNPGDILPKLDLIVKMIENNNLNDLLKAHIDPKTGEVKFCAFLVWSGKVK